MSGLVKGVGKVFKKVAKVVKKIAKPLAIAVAAYFTAGIALSFIPATSVFAASLPGFAGGGFLGTGIGAGATAGTGIFSQVAGAIGLGGKLAAQVAPPISAAAGTAAGSTGAAAAGGFFPSTAAVAAGDTAGVLGALNTGAAVTGGAAAPALAAVGMSLTDKLLMAKIGTDVAGALFGPSPEELFAAQAEEEAKFRGAYYGLDAKAAPPDSGSAPQVQPVGQNAPPQQLAQSTPKAPNVAPGPPGLFPERSSNAPGATDSGQMQQNIVVPDNVISPAAGVRYV